jgi:two-component system nitrate/nitrite response regulator NarL
MSPESEITTTPGALRVLVIDDHTLFRSGLKELLGRRGIEVVAAVGDGSEGCKLVAELKPDVVLLDLRMPEIDGLTVLRRLHESDPSIPVVMLTTSSDERDLVASLRSGAQGYLVKDMEPDQLIDSMHEIVAGNTVVAPHMTGVLAKVVQGEEPSVASNARFSELTAREMEILCHLAEGLSNKVIARELGITDGTVKLHVRSILRKMQVQSRVEAAVRAVEEGVCRKTRAGSEQ